MDSPTPLTLQPRYLYLHVMELSLKYWFVNCRMYRGLPSTSISRRNVWTVAPGQVRVASSHGPPGSELRVPRVVSLTA